MIADRIFSIKLWCLAASILFLCSSALANCGELDAPVKEDFLAPPNEAKPRVWWHWMNGNVTKEGIKNDLEWMSRIGIGGFQNFDADFQTPIVVEHPLHFMTPEWKAAFKYAAELADSKGLEMAIAGSPGWSETGGPWVAASDGMKKYVWTETSLKGGQTFKGILPQPSSATGHFQDVESKSYHSENKKHYYKDSMVIAYKRLPSDLHLAALNPTVSSSGGNFSLSQLTDGKLNKTTYLPPANKAGEEFWVQYAFENLQTFKAMSVEGANHANLEQYFGGPENRKLMSSNDGIHFSVVEKVSGSISPQNSIAFKSTTAKYWRLSYTTIATKANPITGGAETAPEGVHLSEFVLYSSDRIDQLEDKVGITPWREDQLSFTNSNADAINPKNVINLTNHMKSDGSLEWKVPKGDWVVLRFGYSLTGTQNHPASPSATGLEVDKMDEEAVRRYINTYLDMYNDATGGLMGKRGLQYIVLDSYEAGPMNWTHDFSAEFKARRHYDIEKWMPVLTGVVVESRGASEKFLWDFRKTIGEMIAENHYDVIGEELKKRGMGRYTESHEGGRIFLADGMDVKKNADIPMSAMWTPGSLAPGPNEEVRSQADIRESASVSHIYGKSLVAAESMTSVNKPFKEHPEKLKRTADMELASGLNRFVIHTSVHQPLEKPPGFTLGPFGQYFSRHETWSEQAKGWIDYLSRSSYMLQKGKFVADALVYYGENSNITWEFREALPQLSGYEFDFVNASALVEAVNTNNGKMVTPGGGTYSLLILDDSAKSMTLPVLRKIKELADAGIAITGTKPEKSPSLLDDEKIFISLVNSIWSKPNVSQKPAEEILKSLGVDKDVEFLGRKADILYVHRTLPDSDIYWLNSRSDLKNNAEVSFRVTDRTPMMWHPETGKLSEVSYEVRGNRTIVSLCFEPWEAYFIVFKDKSSIKKYAIPSVKEQLVVSITSPWRVEFQQNRGAPKNIQMNVLSSWSEHGNAGVKYFSGTASYHNTFNMEKKNLGSETVLDLGSVKNIAEVIVNGESACVLWNTPFKCDISSALKEGENKLEVKVTNLWVNRLIGDAQADAKERFTFTVSPFYAAKDPLLSSGLLGPVKVFTKIPSSL